MMRVEREKSASEEDVVGWCRQADDSNPLHLSEQVAGDSIFGERIVPGILAAGWISGCISQLAQAKDEDIALTKFDVNFEKAITIDQAVTVWAEEEQTAGPVTVLDVGVTDGTVPCIEGKAVIREV